MGAMACEMIQRQPVLVRCTGWWQPACDMEISGLQDQFAIKLPFHVDVHQLLLPSLLQQGSML
jgi:hypothetical protein